MTTTLRDELAAALAARAASLTLTTDLAFGDLLWDADMTVEEVQSLDAVVFVDAVATPRRPVVQRIRGELRYWLTTHRDIAELYTIAETELALVESFTELVSLIERFICDGASLVAVARNRKTPSP